jgi:hypothetical protein
MALVLRKRADGSLHLMGDAPDEHNFSPEKLTELALEGIASIDGRELTLRFANAEIVYNVRAFPGERSTNEDGSVGDYIDAEWSRAYVLERKGARRKAAKKARR